MVGSAHPILNMQSGILLIDKPAGVTSFEVVRRVRRRLSIRKVGHLGTLDPFATGCLPLCLKEATKLVPYLMPEPKTYRAVLRLGVTTDTQDLTGQVVARSETWPTPAEVRRVAAGFVGELDQTPPMYSALHYQGQRLYELARRGEVVALAPRKVVVHRLRVDEIDLPEVTLTVRCSQGTYIRTLAHDLGSALGCGGHLTALRRLEVGPFPVEEALPLAALDELTLAELVSRLIPLTRCLPGMKRVTVAPEQASQLRQGRPLPWAAADLLPGEQVQVLAGQDLAAVAWVQGQPGRVLLSPARVFARELENC
jgi:tRNA pseudouridine55 synthase